MRTLVVTRHAKDGEISSHHDKITNVDTLEVGKNVSPQKVQDYVYHYAGLEYSQIVFQTHLPEDADTSNAAYLMTRLRPSFIARLV